MDVCTNLNNKPWVEGQGENMASMLCSLHRGSKKGHWGQYMWSCWEMIWTRWTNYRNWLIGAIYSSY